MTVASWTFSADGNGDGVIVTPKSEMQLVISGTIGSGTVTFQVSFDGGSTWLSVRDSSGTAISFTATGVYGGFRASQGEMIRAVLTGSTSPTLTVELREVV